jgi:hypothetical protein
MPITKSQEKQIGFGAGFVLILAILAINLLVPDPTASQEQTFRIVLAMAGGAFGAFIPGLLNVNLSGQSSFGKFGIKAAGALAMFVVIFFWNPAGRDGDIMSNKSSPQVLKKEDSTRVTNEDSIDIKTK